MSTWFEFEAEGEQGYEGEGLVLAASVDALEGAKDLAREDGKSWALLSMTERDEYLSKMCEAIVAMGGSRV